MIEFQCDYAEGAHPKILERMIETNMDQTPGYGLDPYCDEARHLIRKACGREDIDVQFLVGGTQTNTTIICSVLIRMSKKIQSRNRYARRLHYDQYHDR